MQRAEFSIGQFTIGDNFPPFIIAEAGVHHYNSVELAKAYIREARIAGVHAIKFQTYKAERIATHWAPTYWDTEGDVTQFDIFANRSRLTQSEYTELFRFAHELGILFLSTPFDEDSASLLNDLGVPAFKTASADITHIPMLKHIASFKKPIIMSTGASNFDEIRHTLDTLKPYDVPIALLHCSLSYPTALPEANLQRVTALREAFPEYIIGYSDHTQPQDSELACPVTVAMGARIIEKHFTLNKHLDGDDHYHAVDQQGLIRLVKNCRETFAMTTKFEELTETEMAARTYARRSIVASHPLAAGTVLVVADVDFKRPGTGVAPTEVEKMLGKRIKHDIEADALITFDDLDE